MRIEGFTAVADVVGRRVKASWEVVAEGDESLAAAPQLVLRRKERDFELPPRASGDPFLVYDSAAFPPPGTTVTELDLGGAVVDGGHTVTVAESASAVIAGTPTEVLRRTRTTTFGPDERARRRREEILDVAGRPEGLAPGTTLYYQLTTPPPGPTPEPSRATATPTEVHGTGRSLYESLPSVYRRHDVVAGPLQRPMGAVPEANPVNGQLRRFLDLFGSGLDHLRSRADGLRSLHDVDNVDARLLPHLAHLVGWDLSVDQPIPLQRHEVKYAAPLYRITGTVPGCQLWAKRLTGWDVDVKEFWQNVFVTNDVGNPDDLADRGSRTVDTGDAAALARMGGADDTTDYVYDTGTGPDDRYAFNVIGFFVTPREGETVDEVLRLRSRLMTNTNLFLPFNLRAVVVVQAEAARGEARTHLGLTATTDPGV
ncbi:MAG: phage tail protein [Acidimicrobiales bacterium]